MYPRNFGSEKIVRTGNRGLFCMKMRDRWTSDVHGGSPQGLPSSKWRVSKLSLTVGDNGYFSTDQDDFMTAKSREFVTQLIISKPLPSFSWGKPIGWPSSPGISLVRFSRTSSLFSSTKNLIFFTPRPACCKICFSEEDCTLHACRSAKHTNWPVHVRRDGFFLLADFEVPEPFSRRLLYGWKSLLLSSINCWAWEEPTELVEATFVCLSPSANCLQFSLRRTRSPKASTPRRIRQLHVWHRQNNVWVDILICKSLGKRWNPNFLKDGLHFVPKWWDQRKRESLETNIPAMPCGYINTHCIAHQTFCTPHNIAAEGQCRIKVHKHSTVVNVTPNDTKMNHI